MSISELVSALSDLQAEHGDLEVEVYPYGDITSMPASAPTVRSDGTTTPFVLIEP